VSRRTEVSKLVIFGGTATILRGNGSLTFQVRKFERFADYHQFYLWDPSTNPLAPQNYTNEDVDRRIKVGPHVVVIQPERNMTVRVVVELHDSEPPFNMEKWDHIAEASLHLPTGHLQVHECCGGSVAEFHVEPGWYRVRSFHGEFATIEEDGLEGDDRYLVVMWPAADADVCVIKQGPIGRR